jgi:uncharacterized protein
LAKTHTSLRAKHKPRRQWHSGKWQLGKLLLLALLATGIGINAVAWMQARAMTHYVTGKERTAKPEKLSWLDKVGVVFMGVRLPRPVNYQTPANLNLSYKTYRVAVDGPAIAEPAYLETWFVAAPSAQKARGVVLLFPPYGGSKSSVLAPAKTLHNLGYHTLLIDFRGAGGSSGSDTTLGVREADDVVMAVADAHRRWPGQPIVLYGASMGAAAVMRAVAQGRVRPEAVILESPFDRLLHAVRHRFTAIGLPSFPAAELIVWWGGWQQKIDGFNHNPVDYASSVTCPTLLFYGQRDQRVTPADTQAIFGQIVGPKQLVVLPGTGHGGLAREQPKPWQQSVGAFLARSLPGLAKPRR